MELVLIGSGTWGKNYISTINNFPNVSLIVANKNNWKSLLDQKPNGVIIATPPNVHFPILSHALSLNIPTMIEKPLMFSNDQFSQLSKSSTPILVNYLHLFSPYYQKIKDNIKQIKIIVSNGYNDGPIREYCNGLWDYGVHDLAMILDLAQEFPKNIEIKEINKNNEKSLYEVNLEFKRFNSKSQVGNGGERAVRNLVIETEQEGTLIYDDVWERNQINYSPPLTEVLRVFLNAIEGKKDARLGVDLSWDIARVLSRY